MLIKLWVRVNMESMHLTRKSGSLPGNPWFLRALNLIQSLIPDTRSRSAGHRRRKTSVFMNMRTSAAASGCRPGLYRTLSWSVAHVLGDIRSTEALPALKLHIRALQTPGELEPDTGKIYWPSSKTLFTTWTTVWLTAELTHLQDRIQ